MWPKHQPGPGNSGLLLSRVRHMQLYNYNSNPCHNQPWTTPGFWRIQNICFSVYFTFKILWLISFSVWGLIQQVTWNTNVTSRPPIVTISLDRKYSQISIEWFTYGNKYITKSGLKSHCVGYWSKNVVVETSSPQLTTQGKRVACEILYMLLQPQEIIIRLPKRANFRLANIVLFCLGPMPWAAGMGSLSVPSRVFAWLI